MKMNKNNRKLAFILMWQHVGALKGGGCQDEVPKMA